MANVFDKTTTEPVITNFYLPFSIDLANTSGLNLAVLGGVALLTGALAPSAVVGATFALTDNATSYISLNLAAGTIVNDGAAVVSPHAPLYIVTTANGAIISVIDSRVVYYPAVGLASNDTVLTGTTSVEDLTASGTVVVTGIASAAAATAAGHLARADQIQKKSLEHFTTGGTATAYTLTPTPALAALTTGHRFQVTIHTPPGASPTLAISGLTAKALKYYIDAAGAKAYVTSANLPAGTYDIFYDGTDYVVLNPRSMARNIITFTRDMTAASGNVSYTGAGFKPSKVTLRWGIDASVYHGNGTALATEGEYSCVYAGGLTGTDTGTSSIVQYTTDTATYQVGVLTMTADGFDIAWVKGGFPTGTLRVNAICEV